MTIFRSIPAGSIQGGGSSEEAQKVPKAPENIEAEEDSLSEEEETLRIFPVKGKKRKQESTSIEGEGTEPTKAKAAKHFSFKTRDY